MSACVPIILKDFPLLSLLTIFPLSKIHLFNPERGAKAFSYFGTIAKRYLILSNQKNYKKRIILIDRFIDSTIAYQHYGMSINKKLIIDLHQKINA